MGAEIIKLVTGYAEALCSLYLRVDVHSSLAQGYCYIENIRSMSLYT